MAKATSNICAARVYSYLRFSTPEQALGDSERRQLEAARAWAKRKGLELDESIKPDRGLSGYHGHHRKHGNLGDFLALVESGGVARGSILLVENIDRLGREGVSATLRQIIFKLWDNDITLQTLSPEESYEPGSDESPKFLALFLYMQRARDESAQKSYRIRAARDRARVAAHEEKRVLTKMCPAWLRVVNKQFEVIPEAAETIRMIFELKLQGMGTGTIQVHLNKEAPWTPPANKKRKGTGWRDSYIKKILGNRAVIGEYQPHQKRDGKRRPVGDPIGGYFPSVVLPDAFNAVQQRLDATRGKGGRTGKVTNLFTHLVKCAYCGGPMHLVDKGKPPKGAQYLVCDNGRRGVKCARHRIRYDEVEVTVLANCWKLRPEQVLPNPDEQSKLCLDLQQRLRGKTSESKRVDCQLANVEDAVVNESNSEVRERLKRRMEALCTQQAAIKAEIVATERALEAARRGADSFTKWKANLETLREALGNPAVRVRLQAHFREFIDSIEIFATGHSHAWDSEKQCGDDFYETMEAAADEYFPEIWRDKVKAREFRDFLSEVTRRRMSKEGRFLRIHFRTGAVMNVVPDGSIADGMELTRASNGRRFVGPNIWRLWNEYHAGKV